MKPIYIPKGAAKEYGDFALNIYTGCPHRCYYCFAPSVLHRDREEFHGHVEPRKDIVEETKRQLEREKITEKLIHLCFTCDPYPTGCDTTPTREIIKAIKSSGNHVQILTKGDGTKDFDLLDGEDWYGVTYSGYESGTLAKPQSVEPWAMSPLNRLASLSLAHETGIKTWISMEPVLNSVDILNLLELSPDYVDRYKIGKLNYHPSDIDWKAFGERAESICKSYGLNYYIKDRLRKKMEASTLNHSRNKVAEPFVISHEETEYIAFKCLQCKCVSAYPSNKSDGRRCQYCKGKITPIGYIKSGEKNR